MLVFQDKFIETCISMSQYFLSHEKNYQNNFGNLKVEQKSLLIAAWFSFCILVCCDANTEVCEGERVINLLLSID